MRIGDYLIEPDRTIAGAFLIVRVYDGVSRTTGSQHILVGEHVISDAIGQMIKEFYGRAPA